MYKCFFGLVVTFIILIFPAYVSAGFIEKQGSNNFQSYYFSVHGYNNEPDAPEYVKDTSDILIDITAWKDEQQQSVFTANDKYYIFFERPGYSCTRTADLSLRPATSEVWATNANQLSFSLSPKHAICDLTPGTYSIKVWSSRDSKPFIEGMSFPINSPGGGSSAKMAHVGDDLICKNRVTEVEIQNAEIGKSFNIYWNGDQQNYAWQGKATERNFKVELSGGDGKLQPGTKPKLCLIEGDVRFIPALQIAQCGNSLDFDYSADENKCASSTKKSCEAKVDSLENNTTKKQAKITGNKFPGEGFPDGITTYRGDLVDTKNQSAEPKRFPDLKASANGTVTVNTGQLALGTYVFNFYPQTGDREVDSKLVCQASSFTIDEKVETGNSEVVKPVFESTQCLDGKCATSSGELCNTTTGKSLIEGESLKNGDGIRTAIGCIPTDPSKFIAGLMKYITGFAGGIALLMMVFGAFQMMTSAGNADGLKKGREQFVSAVIGLLFVIFATLLMQIIGVDILGLPGFTK